MALAFLIGTAVAWDNGVARTPPLGYSNWNNFHNNINSSLFIETASMFADASAFPPHLNYNVKSLRSFCFCCFTFDVDDPPQHSA